MVCASGVKTRLTHEEGVGTGRLLTQDGDDEILFGSSRFVLGETRVSSGVVRRRLLDVKLLAFVEEERVFAIFELPAILQKNTLASPTPVILRDGRPSPCVAFHILLAECE